MAYTFISSDSLQAIADAIRRQTQGTEKMTPAEMAEAIDTIGSAEVDYLASLENNTLIAYESDTLLKLGRNLFDGKTALKTISVPNCTVIDQYCFNNATGLERINAPSVVTASGSNLFYKCTSLTEAKFPKITSVFGSSAFSGCTSLTTVDLGKTYRINGGAFSSCTSLTTVILRKTDTICALQNVSAFSGCGTNISVYVPSNLISAYMADSVWSSVTDATLSFVALEGSVFE